MTNLLISVQNETELALAAGAGVPLLDLKSPADGPLAPAPLNWIRRVARRHATSSAAVSVALGEWPAAIDLAERLPDRGIAFAKMGPADSPDPDALTRRWAELRKALPASIELVAVAYADHREANCPPPDAVARAAIGAGLRRLLIDTFTKDGRSSLDHLDLTDLATIAEWAQSKACWWALAGSIRIEHVRVLTAARLWPDCYAIRGAACAPVPPHAAAGQDPRTAPLCPERVRRWLQLVGETARPVAAEPTISIDPAARAIP